MARNYSIDFLKAFMAIGIIMIHTGTFIIGKENLTISNSYIYSMTSLFVPTFFIISGYFYAKSSNKERAIINTIIQYIIYSILCIILNIIIFGKSYNFNDIDILMMMQSVNYFWFVNSLIYYMLFFYVVSKLASKKLDIYFWCSILILLINIINLSKTNNLLDYKVLEIIYFSTGYILSKFEFKISKKLLTLVLLYPIFAGFKYQTIYFPTLIFSVILFIIVKDVKMKETKFSRLSKDSLKILFIHYYVITILQKISITDYTGYHIIINFIIASSITLIILYTINYVINLNKIYNKNLYST